MDVLRELLHPEYKLHNSSNDYSQLENKDLSMGIEPSINRTKNIIKGWQDRIFDIFSIVAEGDEVSIFYRLTFTHSQEFIGIPTTGKRISINAFHYLRFKEGKIIELTFLQDTHKILRELGKTIIQQNDKEKVQTYLENLRRLKIIPR